MHYYESHKYHISYKINSIKETIFSRLLPVYENIEEEAKIIAKKKLEELGKSFNPDTMDVGDAYQEAWEDGTEHYVLQHAMKVEFLLSTATWLFHLFEKDCREMCPSLYNKPEELKKKLEEMGISCDVGSNWYKTNTELRLVANTIKHGEGKSCDRLKGIKPEYFKTNTSYLTDNKIEIPEEDMTKYIDNMSSFWDSFFDKVLPKYE
ncbi:MAG: hypothetical protein OQK98_07235 [Gammaproteobacteria bacterium]|nr:hypothetical protein [Gammaproteobacteria bacterium]